MDDEDGGRDRAAGAGAEGGEDAGILGRGWERRETGGGTTAGIFVMIQ